ncbi:MAG: UDP-N-acetylmuramoyl-tripeptide--D-alanyl-D-alanine ligase [Flavobacterium sp.]|nr:UDP-N-acetylmuramoyl-tripeptide--D-alanyl-D-alanine ligase [Flavobacterium sp.]
MNIESLYSNFQKCSLVTIDTRKIIPNCMFIALKGENFDANIFAQEALDKGAKYVIIDNKNYFIDSRTILVKNSLEALQDLAQYHRRFLKTPIIALTGSNGKTTTKELINIVLSKKFNTTATIGNLNNHIGVPLTLLSFSKNTEIGIVEMGANHQKEIEFLCRIAEPNFGYITNFGKAHLEGFGGIEGVIKGKSEMYDYLRMHNKVVFVNSDDPIQIKKSKNINSVFFGENNQIALINLEKITANPFATIRYNDLEIKSNLIGLYNANNICAAITIGKYFDVSDQFIKEGIENYIPENNRSQLINKNSNEIILDAYNANPSSMKAALDNFIQLDKNNKTIIIGDMFELGAASFSEHKSIVEQMINENNIRCIFVGNYFYQNKINKSNFYFFSDFTALKDYIIQNKILKNTILIKGSRGMALERILEIL